MVAFTLSVVSALAMCRLGAAAGPDDLTFSTGFGSDMVCPFLHFFLRPNSILGPPPVPAPNWAFFPPHRCCNADRAGLQFTASAWIRSHSRSRESASP